MYERLRKLIKFFSHKIYNKCLSLIYKRDELYGLKPEDIEYQKEIKFIKDKQAILEGLNNG